MIRKRSTSEFWRATNTRYTDYRLLCGFTLLIVIFTITFKLSYVQFTTNSLQQLLQIIQTSTNNILLYNHFTEYEKSVPIVNNHDDLQ